jgi:F0F1-type ATP synthase delta subunit
MEHKPRAGQLPTLAVGPIEVNRLIRELETIDNTLLSHTLRKQEGDAKMLKTSHLMDQVVSLNKLNLLQKDDRERLSRFLKAVKQRAPVLHISFSADPSPAFLEKLMSWLRREIHPQILVTIGVQPTIAAGCIVRSANKIFDFSLRQEFTAKRGLLIERLTNSTPIPVRRSQETNAA